MFNSAAIEVVRRFQRARGMVPDGIIGPKAWAALDSLSQGNDLAETRYAMIDGVVGILAKESNATRIDLEAAMSKRLVITLFVAVNVSGCAVTYVDKSGEVQVIGFVKMSVPLQASSSVSSPPIVKVHVTSIGASILHSEIATGFSLGYASEELIGIPNNSFVTRDIGHRLSPPVPPAATKSDSPELQ